MTKTHLLNTLFFIFIIITFYSCYKDSVEPKFSYEAEVIGRSLDCGDFEIKITRGTQKARLVTGINSNIYTAKNLPEDLKVKELKIKLNVRKIKTTELTPCTTLGIPYPWIFITEAEKF